MKNSLGVSALLLLAPLAFTCAPQAGAQTGESTASNAMGLAARAGKNLCVQRVMLDPSKGEILRKYKISLGDLCGCVERELLITYPVGEAMKLYTESEMAKPEDTSPISQESVGLLTKLEGAATRDCLGKLMR